MRYAWPYAVCLAVIDVEDLLRQEGCRCPKTVRGAEVLKGQNLTRDDKFDHLIVEFHAWGECHLVDFGRLVLVGFDTKLSLSWGPIPVAFHRAAWPLVARTLLALVIPCEQVGNAYVVELVQRQQQSGFGIDPQFEVNSSMMVAACGSSVSSSMQLCVSSGA